MGIFILNRKLETEDLHSGEKIPHKIESSFFLDSLSYYYDRLCHCRTETVKYKH